MTLTGEDKIELARYRISRAEGLLGDAETLANAGSYASSVNRAYYAVLMGVRSLLILRGIDADTHESAKIMLSKEFIRKGILPREFGETFRAIQARRMDADYGDYIEIDSQEALDALKRAKEFINKIRQVEEGMLKVLSSVKK